MLEKFISKSQLKVLNYYANNGSEKLYFQTLLKKWENDISKMPKTYEQDGKGDDAIIYLHYYTAGSDFYITERDVNNEQNQAFGLVCLNGNYPELGYISINEMKDLNVEFDLNWVQKTVKQIKNEKEK